MAEPPTVAAPPSVTEPLKKSARDVAKSAGAVKQSAKELTSSADRTTQLAADRTVLAAERTYAAWIRTGLGALASGVGAKALLQPVLPAWLVTATGSVLVIFAGFCFVAAVWRQFRRYAPPRPDTPRMPRPLILAINGFLVLVTLAVLLGVWFGGAIRL
ncbi:MAG TPA: DUF202 domain-containing protein [Caulobacteraceae bacterium]|jgi:putative membrane protein|nr:DUF202 domain-containing protein [Caulobacteraceae bacterium]